LSVACPGTVTFWRLTTASTDLLSVSNCKHRLFVGDPSQRQPFWSDFGYIPFVGYGVPDFSQGGTPRRPAETLNMRTTIEEVLEAAGIRGGERPVEVLRDGFPSYVIRVSTTTFSGCPTVIMKACPHSSREPDILLCLDRAGFSVPNILDVRQGEGFRVVIMEDIGTDALHKRRDPEWYMRAVQEIAKIHKRFDLSMSDVVAPERMPAISGFPAGLAAILPRYDLDKWTGAVREAVDGTVQRLKDGTYRGFTPAEIDALVSVLGSLATDTLSALGDRQESYKRQSSATEPSAQTLVHGDFHDGNVLVRSSPDRAICQFAFVDWDSARLDSGFFDLVSLYDVAERMETCRLDPETMIATYLDARWPDGERPDASVAETEWQRCRMLRAWDELRWFSTTGDDFGDRVRREVGIMRRTLSAS
jgi:hypothetical protein